MKLILSFDGGGVRGIYSAIVLSKIRNACPGFVESASLYAGTSTGGIIACGLAKGLPPSEIVRAYKDLGEVIFSEKRWFSNIFRAKYSNNNAINAFKKYFHPDLLMRDLPYNVLIPTVELNRYIERDNKATWDGHFIHNMYDDRSHLDMTMSVWEVLAMTTAAPTYFPSYLGHVDGGVYVNNPSMCAVAQLCNPAYGGDDKLPYVLSFGTGRDEQSISGLSNDWGILKWGTNIISLISGGSTGVADYQCRQLLGDKYYRVNSWLDQKVKLDNASKMDDLIKLANDVDISPILEWIKTIS